MKNYQELAVCTRLIEDKTAEIIKKVNEYINLKPVREGLNFRRDGKRQFNDIVEAAASASCVDELVLYISYKKAKEGSRSMWSSLADPLVKVFSDLNEMAKSIYAEAVAKQKDIRQEEIHLELCKKFAGYLMWKANTLIADAR